MLNFGAAKSVDFLPDDDARAWVADGLQDLVSRLGAQAQKPRLIEQTSVGAPKHLDDLFELICGVQSEVGQSEVEFTLLEMAPDSPPMPKGFAPLGNPEGQLMHTFHRRGEYIVLAMPAVFRVGALVLGSVARELGRIAIHRVGGHDEAIEAKDYEGDAELAGIALGMGVWVANGAYVYENACCGGGCGIDLTSVRAGLSMPEACFGVAVDAQRKGIARRVVARHLDATQKAALKRSWGFVAKQPALTAAPTQALPG